MNAIRAALLVLLALGASGTLRAACRDDVVDRRGAPTGMREFDATGNQRFNPLFDAGAWHGFLLPPDRSDDGGFTGPLVVAEEYAVFIGRQFDRLQLLDAQSQPLDYAQAVTERCAAPGRLRLDYRFPELQVTLELRFIDGRTAAVRTTLRNRSAHPLQLTPVWTGAVLTRFDARDPQRIDARTPGWHPQWREDGASLRLSFGDVADGTAFSFGPAAEYRIARSLPTVVAFTPDAYRAEGRPLRLAAHATRRLLTLHRYTFTADEAARPIDFKAAELAFAASAQRWARYRQAIERHQPPALQPIAWKALETLIGNWRSPAGALRHDAIVPSTTSRWFNGLWPWDSWKHAAGIARYDARLARSGIEAMFDYQVQANDAVRPQDAGMVIDAVFFRKDAAHGDRGTNWNERNTKPPLASWAVWQVHRRAPDLAWLRRMYPKLVAYHHWWYRNRDHDHDGLAEYGATVDPAHADADGAIRFHVGGVARAPDAQACHASEGDNAGFDCVGDALYRRLHASGASLDVPALEAAGWESGMDNAPRFFPSAGATPPRMRATRDARGRLLGWSIDQVSVDLNAYLALDKRMLAAIAHALGRNAEARVYARDAAALSARIDRCFFDPVSGFYYDRRVDDDASSDDNAPPHTTATPADCPSGALLTDRGRGMEGIAPVWVGSAGATSSAAVIRTLLRDDEFATALPFPTAARSNPSFDPVGYWRGRVWLDQYGFALRALADHGHRADADRLCTRLLARADGIAGRAPIRENYNPLTGAGLGATNFSWSAAHLLTMLADFDCASPAAASTP